MQPALTPTPSQRERGRDPVRSDPLGRVAPVVDPRLGFNLRVMSTLLAEIGPSHRSGVHRHLYEEVSFILSGEGFSIIDDRRFDWKAGDALSIPVFRWRQHINTGSEPARFLVHTSRTAMQNLGLLVVQQGDPADEQDVSRRT